MRQWRFWHSLWNNGGPLFSCDIKLSRQWPPRRGRGRCVVHSAVKAAAISALLLNSKDATFVTASQRAFRRSLHCSIPPNYEDAGRSLSMTNYKTMIIPMTYILIFLNLDVDICGKFLVYFQNTFESVRLKVYGHCTSILNEGRSLTFICVVFPSIFMRHISSTNQNRANIFLESYINTELFTHYAALQTNNWPHKRRYHFQSSVHTKIFFNVIDLYFKSTKNWE